jgi:acyl-CoA reductase-like NAD-dependent aldehyde dehydrogenase
MATAVSLAATKESLAGTRMLLIDGKHVEAKSGRTFEVLNPATEEVIATVAEAGAADVDAAVVAARRSFERRTWRGMPGAQRARILLRYADLIDAHAEELSLLETLNNGMPRAFAERSTRGGANWLRWFAGGVTRISGSALSSALSVPGEFHAYTRKEPVGVVGLITPWNGPIGTFMIKVSPALAAGCSCVHKPSEITPLTALRLGELALEAGLPEGVLNIVPGFGADAGAAIAHHPDINKISFTGSTAVGKELVRASAGNLKRVTLELGGKSPCVVFDDADMDIAIPGAAMAIAANSGQVCFAGSRLFVQRKSYDRVVAGIGSHMQKLKIGNGLEPETMLGPLVSSKQRDRVLGYIDSGVKEGARLWWSTAFGKGVFCSTYHIRERAAEHENRPGGDLRSGACGDTVRPPGRDPRARECHVLRSRRRHLHHEHQSCAQARRPHRIGQRLGELLQHDGCCHALRRIQGIRLGTRAQRRRSWSLSRS